MESSPTASSPSPTSNSESALRAESLVSNRLHLVLAALSGLLYYLSFPGVDFWPLTFVVWTPWMLGLVGRTPKQALLGGLVLGLVVGVTGFYWLLEMLETFSGFGPALCAVFMLLLCAYQAGRFSLLGWLYVRGVDRGHARGLLFCLAFVASETAYPMLFPFTFAATVHEVYPLVQVAEIGGPIAVGLTLLAPSWLLALVLESRLRLRRAGRPATFRALLGEVGPKRAAALLAVPVVSALYGLVRIVQVDAIVAHAEKIKVGLVQANMGLAEKRTEFEEGRRRHEQATKKLRTKHRAELVVWSETSLAGAIHERDVEAVYGKLAKKLKVPTIMGAVLARRVDDARKYALFNSAVLGTPEGRIEGRYDKQYLLAFGEYLPLGERFPILYEWSPKSGHFTPGTSFSPLRFGKHEIAVFICYEDIIPSFVNRLMNESSPELLVNMTNDAWFGDTTEPWEHMALSTLRAVEQRRFFVRSTNSGISGFVDPVGRILQKTGTFEQAAIAQEVAWMTSWTPYRLLGNWPWIFGTLASFGFAFFRRRAPSR